MATVFTTDFTPNTDPGLPAPQIGPAATFPGGATYRSVGGESQLVTAGTTPLVVYPAGQVVARAVTIAFTAGTLPVSGRSGVALSFNGGFDGYGLLWDSVGALVLQRSDGGAFTTLDSGGTIAPGDSGTITVTATTITATVGATVLTATDSTYSGTDLGLIGSLRSLTVTDLAGSVEQPVYSTAGLIERIRNLYDETDASNSASSQAQMLFFINAALNDLGEFAINPQVKTLSGGIFSNATYEFTERVLRVDSVEVNSYPIGPLRFEDKQYFNSLLTLGTRNTTAPPGWAFRGNSIVIPAINAGDSVVIYYQGALDEQTLESTPQVPFYCNNFIIFKVLEYLNLKDQSPMADRYGSMAAKELKVIKNRWRSVQTPLNQIVSVWP